MHVGGKKVKGLLALLALVVTALLVGFLALARSPQASTTGGIGWNNFRDDLSDDMNRGLPSDSSYFDDGVGQESDGGEPSPAPSSTPTDESRDDVYNNDGTDNEDTEKRQDSDGDGIPDDVDDYPYGQDGNTGNSGSSPTPAPATPTPDPTCDERSYLSECNEANKNDDPGDSGTGNEDTENDDQSNNDNSNDSSGPTCDAQSYLPECNEANKNDDSGDTGGGNEDTDKTCNQPSGDAPEFPQRGEGESWESYNQAIQAYYEALEAYQAAWKAYYECLAR